MSASISSQYSGEIYFITSRIRDCRCRVPAVEVPAALVSHRRAFVFWGRGWFGIRYRMTRGTGDEPLCTEYSFGAKNRLLVYGRDIRYRKRTSTARDAFFIRGALPRKQPRDARGAVTAQTQDYPDTLSINAVIITGTKECHKHPKTHQTHQML